MTITELQSDETLRRHEFPVTATKAFFGHAGVCPLPRRVAEAMTSYIEHSMRDDQEVGGLGPLLTGTRMAAARLIKAKPDEIALIGPTSLALSFVASGLRVGKNENILVYHDDYPSNVYPWMALANRGVQVRFINTRELGKIRPIDVVGQVDENTRLVALASCHYVAGFQIDVDEIGRQLHQRGILFCLDAIQTLGVFPTSVDHVDFLAADSHKWMLGPCGAGILYVRKQVQSQLTPIVHGWHNIRCPDFLTQDELKFHEGARQFEAGTHTWSVMAGLKACIELLEEVGVSNIATELRRKRAWLTPKLQEKGYEVMHANAPVLNWGGMVSFDRELTNLDALHHKLLENGVVTSLRAIPGGKKVIRISPHFYNTEAELEKLLSFL